MTQKEMQCQEFIDAFIENYGPANAYCNTIINDVSKYLLIKRLSNLRRVLKLWKTRKSKSFGDVELKLLETELFKWIYTYDTGKAGIVRSEWRNEVLSNGMTKNQLIQKLLDESLIFIEKK